MSLKRRLRVAFVCAVLQVGALAGVPMRPEQVQALMHMMNEPKLAHALPDGDDQSGDLPGPGDGG
jgi:hypothetical protein